MSQFQTLLQNIQIAMNIILIKNIPRNRYYQQPEYFAAEQMQKIVMDIPLVILRAKIQLLQCSLNILQLGICVLRQRQVELVT
jgi:hypothetical protein